MLKGKKLIITGTTLAAVCIPAFSHTNSIFAQSKLSLNNISTFNVKKQTAHINGVYHVDQLIQFNGKWYVVDNSIAIAPIDYNNYIPVGPLTVTDKSGHALANQTLYKGSYFIFGKTEFDVINLYPTTVALTIGGEPVSFNRTALGNRLVISDNPNPDPDLAKIKAAGINGFTTGGWSYPAKQCTSFVAGILSYKGISTSKFETLGNGADWAANAKARGVQVDMKPSAGAVVSFKGVPPNYIAPYGHVAYITKVNSNGTFHVYEGNWSGTSFHERDVSMDSAVAGIIHF
ncbi:CHAP domain-containing protein [Lactococcus lactis]|uniref:CHAP domain-containing protein n=1 Tax=Lactococcus lactis TaxID=1358 RepID=UPI001D181EDC|nr:CHAP domain-containing protein [Lactococcus lactis]MCC4121472.1 CHAP domain-containing protein [Lactococcus lactis]